ncbi:MAG: HAMP domain-containing histidine kinase [Nitrospirae bacterium]|nr:HAMP domain-containing histidine kinase [Nitrospirota bacterium]
MASEIIREHTDCHTTPAPYTDECVYVNILKNINLGIIGLDIKKQIIIFQNKVAIDLFKSTIKPGDYKALCALLLPNMNEYLTSDTPAISLTLRYGTKFIGYSVYRVSDRYLWIYATDVTEKMRLNSIAEAVNTMNNIGYIFSGIRHEIGNPVNSIKMTLSVLRDNIEIYSREKVIEYIDRALNEVSRVEYLLRVLKSFSMYENMELQNIQISSFIDNLLSMVMKDFEKKGIKIKTLIRKNAEMVYADPRALQQVMMNILTNASDALKDRENPEILISIYKMNNQIIIRVADNGCGMSEEQQKNLFKPFYTTKPDGTGLGLVIVKKMLTGMNGTIRIESRENIGTEVTLTLLEGRHRSAQ